MSDYPEPDEFDEIYSQRNENLMWDVVGRSMDYYGNIKFRTLLSNLNNKPLAEAFIRLYTEKYVRENFFPQ